MTGILLSTLQAQTAAPAPSGLTPNARQTEWYHREQQSFIHFGPNTFQNVEWGDGTAPVTTFNPTKLDCGQWMRTLKSSGITTAILVIKHHDGFCLWPTQYTEYCVRNATWRSGKGDVLREFTDSCHAYGIKAGIYLSPWDRHESLSGAQHPFGTQAYITYYCNQIVELCKNKPYGPFYEIWQDGAGDIASIKSGDYRKWTDTLHKYMPECIVWATKVSDSCGDVHWVGNEGGTAGDPCWSTCNMSDVYSETGNTEFNGNTYVPAETNTSISNGGWFWHPGETAKDAWELYFTSVARNTVMLLNFPPNTTGWISTADSTAGARMGSYLYGTFRTNLLAGATATANHARGPEFDPKYMLDSSEKTYFASADGNTTDTVVFTPKSAISFDCIMLQEVIQLGQRTQYWSVDAYSNNVWTTISAANNKQCIGYKRSVKWSAATTATQVRLRITGGKACPAIHTFGVYKQTQVTPPSSWNGLPPMKDSTAVAVAPHRSAAHMTPHNVLLIAGDRIVLPVELGGGLVTVKILDFQGHCVKNVVLQGTTVQQRLALTSLKTGSYLVICSSGKRTIERKILNVR
ncbi:MAG TPA: alpha-L-fucosidase [Chitinivibrionales bacterium]